LTLNVDFRVSKQKEMDLQNWTLSRKIKNKNPSEFKFLKPTVLRPEQKIKVGETASLFRFDKLTMVK